jgi:hypothetical protein
MSVAKDKTMPYGQSYSCTEAGAAGAAVGQNGTNIVRINRFVLNNSFLNRTKQHDTYEYFGTHLPFHVSGQGMSQTITDAYPEAPVGSIFTRFMLGSDDVVVGAVKYFKNANNVQGQNWTQMA